RGVKFGRPAALTPHQRREAMQKLANGEAQADVARGFNVSQTKNSPVGAPHPFQAKRGAPRGEAAGEKNQGTPPTPPLTAAGAKLRGPGSAFFGKIAEGHAAG